VNSVNTDPQYNESQLFTVRLWAEDLGNARTEWRGQIQHVTSGETRYFRAWPTLIAMLLAMLPNPDTRSATDDT